MARGYTASEVADSLNNNNSGSEVVDKKKVKVSTAQIYKLESIQQKSAALRPLLEEWLASQEVERLPAKRTYFSPESKQVLDDALYENPYPPRHRRVELSQQLQLPLKAVNKWFEDTRYRQKKMAAKN